MTLKDSAAREAYLKTLLDTVDEAYKAARTEVQEALDAAARETGTRQISVALPNGVEIAKVSLTSGTAETKVVDEEAFKAWVMKHFASEIERQFVATVRPAFAKKVLTELTAAGGTEWADPETGVIHDVPGVASRPARARGHRMTFAETGRDAVMAAWRTGQLAGVALPELTGEPIRCSRCQGEDGPDALCDACARPVP
ncbi:hypothetical protein OS965_02145 [Streptomyces sp. H27-G5]|uniref:hypothetical protein n=1 Tax=Streptomyces sp. H27-G5 TaxID=2996698 RepID=UPI00226FA8FD|nr:hypothetical protein [Streptomyces sp. H27-G5]MCY0916976.1 hypothetical protein [Streptomyces sp. H27-G5]